MARFNGSTAQQGGMAPAPRSVAEAEAAWTPEQIARWQQQQQQQQQAAQPSYPPVHQSPALPPLPHLSQPSQPSFAPAPSPAHEPQFSSFGAQPHAPGQYHQAPPPFGHPQDQRHPQDPQDNWSLPFGAAPSQPAWPPQPARQEPPAQMPRAPFTGYDPNGYAEPPAQEHRHSHPLYPDLPADPRLREHPRTDPFARGQPAQQQHDQWDLAQYPPQSQPLHDPAHQHYAQPQGYEPVDFHAPLPHGQPPEQWQPHPATPYPHHQAGPQHAHAAYQEPTFGQALDEAAHAQQGLGQHYGYDANGQPIVGYDAGQQQYAEGEYEEEFEEPRRRPRALIVAGSLVGAILLGGGMAYGFKKYTAMSATDAKPPVVKAEKSPAKSKPADPGGKDVAHTDKKFLNSLAENGGSSAQQSQAASQPASADPDGGPRKVTTLVVRPDGSIGQQAPAAAPPPPAPPSSGVPGMVIEGGPRVQLRGTPAEPPSPPREAPPVQAQVQPTPSRVASAPPAVRVRNDAQEAAVDSEVKAPVKVVPKKRVAVRDDAAAPSSTGSAPSASRSGSAGFVTVLSSRKTREEAFSEYPDLQTKYGAILSGKTPDVRETDLTAQGKGVVYRLVVGPPGSKEEAISTCNKLKAQGYNSCWATPYQ